MKPKHPTKGYPVYPAAVATGSASATNMVIHLDLRQVRRVFHKTCAKRAGVPIETVWMAGAPFSCSICGRKIATRRVA